MEKDHRGIFPRMQFHQLDISKGKSDIGKEQLMDQELFNLQSSSVSSSRIIYTPSTFARTSLLHLQEVGSLQAVHPHYPRERIWCRFFALSFCLARENFPMRSKLISWAKENVCLPTAEKRTVIRHLTISGRSNGAISMHHPFRLCMRSTKSEAVGRCSIQMI